MNRIEFVNICTSTGVCNKKKAEQYANAKPADYEFTNQDVEHMFVFRMSRGSKRNRKTNGLDYNIYL